MSERISSQVMAYELDKQVKSKADWLETFSAGKQKRPDHEIETKRREFDVLRQAAGDYHAAARRDAA